MIDSQDTRTCSGGLPAFALAFALGGCAQLPPLSPLEDADFNVPERQATVLVGVRNFEAESDFGSTDEQALGGLTVSWARPDDALAWELSAQHSRDDDELSPAGKIESSVSDLSGGLRYRFSRAGVFHPYVGGGVAVLLAESRSSGFGLPRQEDDDWDFGIYLRAGMWAPLGDDVRVGVDFRWLPEEWLGEGDFDLDHTQLALTLGTGF